GDARWTWSPTTISWRSTATSRCAPGAGSSATPWSRAVGGPPPAGAPWCAPAAPYPDPVTELPAVRAREERRRRLSVMKGRATALLGLASAVFLGVTLWGGDSTLARYTQATAEAAMVGGL